jgi:hypothetical protein
MKKERSSSYYNIKSLIYYAESFIVCCAAKIEEQIRIVKEEYNGHRLTNNKIVKSSLIAVGLIVIALLMLTQYH